MRLSLHAVGRLKAGPERDLLERYAERIRRAGPAVGIGSFDIHEIDEARARSANERKKAEGASLLKRIRPQDFLVVLDESGKDMGSREFARMIADQRDEGCDVLSFAIGGPDGLDREGLGRARRTLAFGRNSWPHGLVRVMLAEQIYRAVTILAGHPYHRD